MRLAFKEGTGTRPESTASVALLSRKSPLQLPGTTKRKKRRKGKLTFRDLISEVLLTETPLLPLSEEEEKKRIYVQSIVKRIVSSIIIFYTLLSMIYAWLNRAEHMIATAFSGIKVCSQRQSINDSSEMERMADSNVHVSPWYPVRGRVLILQTVQIIGLQRQLQTVQADFSIISWEVIR